MNRQVLFLMLSQKKTAFRVMGSLPFVQPYSAMAFTGYDDSVTTPTGVTGFHGSNSSSSSSRNHHIFQSVRGMAKKSGGQKQQNQQQPQHNKNQNQPKQLDFNVQLISHPSELDDDTYGDGDDDELGPFKFKASSLEQFEKKVLYKAGYEEEDVVDEHLSIEYYHEEEWKPLTNLQQIAGRKKAVPIRFPAFYDEDDDDDFDDDPHFIDDDDDETSIKGQIEKIVMDLKAQGYTLQQDKIIKGGEVLLAKEYILNLASNDQDKDDDDDDNNNNSALRNLLLNRIGVLDHLQQAIHYPFLWKEPTPMSEMEDGPIEVEWTPKVK
jgi:hypothetical protein